MLSSLKQYPGLQLRLRRIRAGLTVPEAVARLGYDRHRDSHWYKAESMRLDVGERASEMRSRMGELVQ